MEIGLFLAMFSFRKLYVEVQYFKTSHFYGHLSLVFVLFPSALRKIIITIKIGGKVNKYPRGPKPIPLLPGTHVI